MRLNGLSDQIETLAKHLRKREEAPPSLTEVAAVTEVLIRTMDRFFHSVDLKIYQECQSLTDYIANARKEISALEPENPDAARIPRAGKELDAIVKATEEATNTIMTAAEEIMGADPSDTDAYQATVNDAVMRIFEACSFQDITGQRISKVVEALTYIEKQAKDLRNLLDIRDDEGGGAPAEELSEDDKLLNGPALEGEGIDQNEVDALMEAEAAAASEPKAAVAKPAAKPAAKPVEKSKAAAPAPLNGKSVKAETPAPKVIEKEKISSGNDSHTTQDDIDALFG